MIEDRSTANADPSGKTTYVFQDRAGKPGGGKGPLVSNGYYPTMTGHPFMMCTEESVIAFEGNGSRPSHKGVGFSDDGVMYTLNTTEVHGGMYQEPFVYDSHPMDSRVTPCTKNCQTLSTRFGQEYSPNTILIRQPQAERNKESSMIDGNHKPNETRYVVRRITPKECERLQGFPDDYTLIPWPKGQCPDSHRYKALGNSMAVPVMRLIAESIDFALSHPITEDKSDKIAYQTSLFDF